MRLNKAHKPALLLAITDLFDRGILTQNQIPLSPDLVETFNQYFAVVRQYNDQPTIENPFFHLAGDAFWELVAEPGAERLYQPGNVSRAPTIKTLRSTYGRFAPEFYDAIISQPTPRYQLREALIARYFPEHHDQLAAIAGEKIPTPPETILREEPPGRDAAFRHTILEIYDYRCAACGIRVKISDDFSLVEAAHIVPFGVSRNDKPDNGLALCPNHHWAMDRFLIAPCPHPKHRAGIWRVGPVLDSRIEGQRDLVALASQPVIPPSEEKFYPAQTSLSWREQHLTTKY